jgi:outer membrane protein
VKAQELQQMEVEYNQYLAQKDQEIQQDQAKMQNIANEELLLMNNTVNDAINTFIAKYNQEKKFAMILLSQGDIPNDGATNLGTPVLTADPSLDITADVLAGLNAEYKASK